MTYNTNTHHRRSIRLRYRDYSIPGAYFITICIRNHKCLFGKIKDGKMILNDAGKIAEMCWREIPRHYPHAMVDAYIIMPNHVHGIIIIDTDVGAIHELPLHNQIIQNMKFRRNMLIPKIIGRFKMNTAKQINTIRQTPAIPLWQRNYYEHIIRNETELNKTREYIHNNSLNWESDDYYIRGFC
jgi:REP element-mobilizing transposase RayT